jgi:hypothetical protein
VRRVIALRQDNLIMAARRQRNITGLQRSRTTALRNPMGAVEVARTVVGAEAPTVVASEAVSL